MIRFLPLIILLATPAYADSAKWFSTPDGSQEVTGLSPNALRAAYWENDDAAANSNLIAVGAGNYWTGRLNPDEDGTNTGAAVTFWACESSTSTCGTRAGCHPVYPDSDGDGLPNNGVSLDGVTMGRQSVSSDAGPYVCVVEDTDSTDEYRVTLELK